MALVTSLKKRELYQDPSSKENSTGIIKPKLKLVVALMTKLDIYIFAVGTSSAWVGDTKNGLEVTVSDFENINPAFAHMLSTRSGYYTWSNCCKHSFIEISKEFIKVADMKLLTFQDFIKIGKSAEVLATKYDSTKRKLKSIALADVNLAENTARLLGLI